MIKFFRKIRQELLSEGKTGKYLKYAIGEIVLVVIGILIALSINNWNASRIKAKEEVILLKELENSISKDIQELNILDRQAKEDLVSADILINWLDNKIVYHDSLRRHFLILTRTGLRKTFRSQNSIFKVLESKGIDIISNAKLKNQILDLYNMKYTQLNLAYDNYRQNILDYGRPITRTEFKFNGELPDIYIAPIDPDELKTNTELYNVVRLIGISSSSIKSIITELLKHCQQIEAAIETEIIK